MVGIVSNLEQRVRQVFASVEIAASTANRDPKSVTVVAVSKTVGRDAVDESYAAGVRHFGENRVPDAVRKFGPELPEDAVLHMIGQLQTNKAAIAAKLFDLIESVDRQSLIQELEKQGSKLNRVLPVLLQVNGAGEEQKAGCDASEAGEFVDMIVGCPHLEIRGLMTIAPLVSNAEDVRPVFRGLRTLRDELVAARPGLALPELSMGMSNDYPVAIEEGATFIRVGRAIFEG